MGWSEVGSVTPRPGRPMRLSRAHRATAVPRSAHRTGRPSWSGTRDRRSTRAAEVMAISLSRFTVSAVTVCLQVVAQLRWLGTFTGVLDCLGPCYGWFRRGPGSSLEERSLTVLASAPGTISTVAGNGTAGFSGEGGPATGAELSGAFGVAVDGGGDELVADTSNSRVRLVAGSDCSSACPWD